MIFVYSIPAAEFSVPDLYLSSTFRALRDECRLCANEAVQILLSREMKANIKEPGLLKIISFCDVDPVSVLLAFSQVNEIDRTDSEALGPYPYDFASAMIVTVLEWKAYSCKRERHGDTLPGTVLPRLVPR